MTVTVLGPRDPYVPGTIDTTSRSNNWSRGLSPFILGPVPLYEGAGLTHARCMENAWQFSKVYPAHADETGTPTEAYWKWARVGWAEPRANRYPMGKGVKPLYSLWAGKHLDYIEARKRIYSPLYAKAVVVTPAFSQLLNLYRERGALTLWDFDGYNHRKLGMTYQDVLACPERIMGHAFLLAMLLERLK